jgi:hypothetical protein
MSELADFAPFVMAAHYLRMRIRFSITFFWNLSLFRNIELKTIVDSLN